MATKSIFITNCVTIKSFHSNFGHLINSGLISTIDLAMEFDFVTKFGVVW
jgi:hypothetical protein